MGQIETNGLSTICLQREVSMFMRERPDRARTALTDLPGSHARLRCPD